MSRTALTVAARGVARCGALYEWTVVAAAAPDTTIGSGPPATTTSTEALFTFASDQPGATFECDLDGAGFVECETPHSIADLATGSHELQVRAVNAAEIVDPTPAVYAWTVEEPVPPETTIGQSPAATRPRRSRSRRIWRPPSSSARWMVPRSGTARHRSS